MSTILFTFLSYQSILFLICETFTLKFGGALIPSSKGSVIAVDFSVSIEFASERPCFFLFFSLNRFTKGFSLFIVPSSCFSSFGPSMPN